MGIAALIDMQIKRCLNTTFALAAQQSKSSIWVAGALASALCLFATNAWASPPEPSDKETIEDDSTYLTLSPVGVLVAPSTGQIGYQWGYQIGYLARTRGMFAIAVGGSLEHGMTDLGIMNSSDQALDHQVRAQAEVMPGLSLLDDDLFLHLSLGVGYAASIQRAKILDMVELETRTLHGVAFSPGVGLSYRVAGNFTVGGTLGGDLQWLDPAGDTSNAHNVDVKFSLGWMF